MFLWTPRLATLFHLSQVGLTMVNLLILTIFNNDLDGSFFPGRCAHIFLKGSCIGIMGVLHPAVIKNFDLVQPASLLDISVEDLTTHYLTHNV